jgi:2-hydroxy-6-oxonona-2,4-dienedioate hydrolase/2-hydroxy-6-oxo-6-(2'-carboxyphenyl)-hexa-2,4-dienoate hydrolase
VEGEGIPGLLDHLMKFIEAIGAPKVHLVGESLGGWVSTWAAIKYPEKIESVTSVCGAGLSLDPGDQELAAKGLEGLSRLSQESFNNPTRENVRKRMEWLFFDPDKSITDELLEIRYQMYMRIRNDRHGEQQDVAKREGRGPEWQLTRERLSLVKVPYFFLWSDHNPTTPWQVAQKAQNVIPGSRLEVIKQSGHWPQYEQADEFNSLLLDFVGSVSDANKIKSNKEK